MRSVLIFPLLAGALLLAGCDWIPERLPAGVAPEAQEEAAPAEEDVDISGDGGFLDILLHPEDKSDDEITGGFLKSVLKAMSDAGREKREAAEALRRQEDSIARAREAAEKAAAEAALEARREAQRWWKKDFSITVHQEEFGYTITIKRKGDRYYQSRTAMGMTQYYVYYNKDGHVVSYSTFERKYNNQPDKNIDVMLEKWLKENKVFLGYDYVHDYFDNTGQTKTYLGRKVEVWEQKEHIIYVDAETGAVLYRAAKSGREAKNVLSFSTKVDVSDIASHLPKIR